tara:strand:+ start:53 stop:304 length:252 start_codon:yes stop_codon:yes gene_type:complete
MLPICSFSLNVNRYNLNENISDSKLGIILRLTRLSRNEKQGTVSRLLNVSQSIICSWELGKKQIPSKYEDSIKQYINGDSNIC